MKNYLIIGQGIAGSTLAYSLMKAGARVVIVDHHHHESSSVISTGVLNPLSGKRFALTSEYDQYYTQATHFYGDMEKLFSTKFLEPLPITRLLRSKSEQGKLHRKVEAGVIADYLEKENEPGTFPMQLKDEEGSVAIRRGAVCHTTLLMETLKDYFVRKGVLAGERFYYDDVGFSADGVVYREEEFEKIIFCEGYKAQYNPWFQHLNFNSMKGEVLKVRVSNREIQRQIILRSTWLAPSHDGLWAAGGSFNTGELDGLPTAAGHEQIMDGIQSMIQGSAEVASHHAAVRPFLNHQNPIAELHPRFPQMAIFNGLGSKGFLVAPRIAQSFAELLLNGEIAVPQQQYA